MAATQRVEFRIDPESRSRIEEAAAIARMPLSEFVRSAAEDRADEVLRNERETIVPADFFDALIAALDEPPVPNEPLQRAAQRAREIFVRQD